MEVLHRSAKGRRLAIENDHFSCALQSPVLGVGLACQPGTISGPDVLRVPRFMEQVISRPRKAEDTAPRQRRYPNRKWSYAK